MRGITLATLMVVGILAVAATAIGLSYAKYDEATTTVTIEDGIKCCINGKEVSNGDTVTVKLEAAKLKIEVCSEYEQPIGYAGKWTSNDHTVTSSKTDDSTVKSGTFTVDLNHGKYNGILRIGFMDGDGDLANVVLKFTIGEGITVTSGSDEIKDGDTYTFIGDSKIIVKTNDGQRHDVKYSGSWSNDCGMSGGASGQELNSSVTIDIIDMMFFDDGHGTMDIHI